jgi:glycosyltransferase involved in cell wall biosynthesis
MTGRVACFADIRFPLERANGIQTMETCAALARRGLPIRLIVRPDTATPPRDPFAFYGVGPDDRLRIERVVAVGPPAVRRALYLVSALRRALASAEHDVVFTRDLVLASLYAHSRRRRSAPLVYESHGFAPAVSVGQSTMMTDGAASTSAKQRRLAARERVVWEQAGGYVTITQALADELVGRFGRRAALAVVPDGAHVGMTTVTAHRAASGRWSGSPVAAYSGNLYPWKGADLFVEALARVPGVSGLVIGGHPRERDVGRVQAGAAALGLGDRVTFTGMVAPPNVAALLQTADILVLPNTATTVSMRYTSPLKLFEYLAAGRAIVASDLPAFREVLTDGENALLFEAGNAAALAGALRRLEAEPELAARLADGARRTAGEYSWDKRAERLERVFEQSRAEGPLSRRN